MNRIGQDSPTDALIAAFLAGALALISVPAALATVEESRPLDMFERAQVEASHDRPTQALEALKKYPLLNKNAAALSLQAEILMNLDRYAEAEASADKAIALDPKYPAPYGLRGYFRLRRGKKQEAISDLNRNIAIWQLSQFTNTPILATYKNLKKVYLEVGNKAEAARVDKLLSYAEAFYTGLRDRETRNVEEAVEILTRILKDEPKADYARLLRAVIYSNMSKYDLAIKDLDIVAAHCPNLTTAYYLLGDAYFEKGDFAKARQYWLKSMAIDPPYLKGVIAFNYVSMTGRFRQNFTMDDDVLVHKSDVLYLCGVASAREGKWQEALKYFNDCLALYPTDYDALLKRAQAFEKLGKHSLALADLNKAAAQEPEAVDPLLARSKIYESMNDNRNALLDLDRVVKAQPTEFGSYILRGELKMKLKMFDKAVEDFSKAIQISPSEDDAYVARAEAFEKLGRHGEAAADYRKAMQLNPRDKMVIKEKLDRVLQAESKKN